MRCPSCGASVDPDEEFCLECGTIISMHAKFTGPVLEQGPSLRWMWYVLGAVMAILFVAANYHPVMNRLFPPDPVTLALNIDQEKCDALVFPSGPPDCASSKGCRKACTDRDNGICARGGYIPLDGMYRGGHCTCICGPPSD